MSRALRALENLPPSLRSEGSDGRRPLPSPVMEPVDLMVNGRVARLTLNRPDRHNALDIATLSGIPVACRDATAAGVDVLVLAGRGIDFSVGFDLDALVEGSVDDGARLGAVAVDALVDMEAITIARLQGWVVGGGAALAAACDLRVGDPTFRMRIPEVSLGIPMGWGAVPLLVSELGPSLTKDLVMTGRDMESEEAAARGLLSRLMPEGGLDAGVEALVERLLAMPPGPLRATKAQVAESAAVARTGEADAARLAEAVADPGFADRFRSYLDDVRGR